MNRSLIKNITKIMVLSLIVLGTVSIASSSATAIQNEQNSAGIALGDPPVAVISFPQNNSRYDPTQTFRFDGSQSSDPEGGIVTYLWEIDPKPERWGNPPGQPETRPFFNTRIGEPGNYTIVLTVTDDEGLTDQTVLLLEIFRTAGTATTSPVVTGTTTEETKTGEILTIRPNFLPGYSIILALFALLIPLVIRRKYRH